MEGEILPADMSMEINQKHRAVLGSVKKGKIACELIYSFKKRLKNGDGKVFEICSPP